MKIDKNNPGSLYLEGTQITSLPDGLTVGGSLDLRGTQITSLPDGLTVGGSLCLEGTQITSLPDGLTVGRSLYLEGTQITGAQYDCGNEMRTIIAYNHPKKGKVVSLGCFIGTQDECISAVHKKYRGEAALHYISKITAAFDAAK